MFVQLFILLHKIVNKTISVVLNILARWNLVCLDWFVFALYFDFFVAGLAILRNKLLRIFFLADIVKYHAHTRMLSCSKARVHAC